MEGVEIKFHDMGAHHNLTQPIAEEAEERFEHSLRPQRFVR